MAIVNPNVECPSHRPRRQHTHTICHGFVLRFLLCRVTAEAKTASACVSWGAVVAALDSQADFDARYIRSCLSGG